MSDINVHVFIREEVARTPHDEPLEIALRVAHRLGGNSQVIFNALVWALGDKIVAAQRHRRSNDTSVLEVIAQPTIPMTVLPAPLDEGPRRRLEGASRWDRHREVLANVYPVEGGARKALGDMTPDDTEWLAGDYSRRADNLFRYHRIFKTLTARMRLSNAATVAELVALDSTAVKELAA